VTEGFRGIMSLIGLALDAIGVLVVSGGAVVALIHGLIPQKVPFAARYPALRRDLGRAILLGLELLIAGDIIRSVVVDPTLLNVAVLGLIVLIRTFLSMTLQLEVEGRWPWRKSGPGPQPPDTGS
jgi:uncharacterized membrane protein